MLAASGVSLPEIVVLSRDLQPRVAHPDRPGVAARGGADHGVRQVDAAYDAVPRPALWYCSS